MKTLIKCLFFTSVLIACICCKEIDNPQTQTEDLPEKICLDKNTLLLYKGEEILLTATVYPERFKEVFSWTSSDTLVANVDACGNVIAKSKGTTTIVAIWNNNDSYSSSCKVTVSEPEAIDLGLSVKWASFDMGAESVGNSGDTFSWGELSNKSDHNDDWTNYIWCGGTEKTLTKYCSDPNYGEYDNKHILEPEDDVACVRWGGDWRIPTEEEITELKRNCSFEWTYVYGINGVKVTSEVEGYTDRFIFLPKIINAYDVTFWSSSQSSQNQQSAVIFDAFSPSEKIINHCSRCRVNSIRPVSVEVKKPSAIGLNSSNISLYVGWGEDLSVELFPENCSDRYLAWKSSNPKIVEVDNKGSITAKSKGEATITAYWLGDEGISSSCHVNVDDTMVYDKMVDLGLSVRWASCNLGSDSPTEYGGYYAWGETEEKETYDTDTYKWYEESKYTKYCGDDYFGVVDNKTSLDIEDDAAFVKLGSKWRMPTYYEWCELVENCVWKVQEIDGDQYAIARSAVEGYEDKYIILPAAGKKVFAKYHTGWLVSGWTAYGAYWTSTGSAPSAYSAKIGERVSVDNEDRPYRYEGVSIRPVFAEGHTVTKAFMEPSDVKMNIGEIKLLEAKTTPRTGAGMKFSWTSSDPEVADVTDDGYVIARKAGAAVITATWKNNPGIMATSSVSVSSDYVGVPVDLGLSVKWASYNIGATKPEEYGEYFAWGEVKPKEEFTWMNYLWCEGKFDNYTKYNSAPIGVRVVDNKVRLDSEDDAAESIWGRGWRMPTEYEMKELLDNCTWEWITLNGIEGCKVSGNNNSIFLPASGQAVKDGIQLREGAGACYYWSSSCDTDGYAQSLQYSIHVHYYVGQNIYMLQDVFTSSRDYGLPIRPVIAQ